MGSGADAVMTSTICSECRKMHKNVLAALTVDEAVAFASLNHFTVSMCSYCFTFRLVICLDIGSYRSFYSIVQAEIEDQAVQVTSL